MTSDDLDDFTRRLLKHVLQDAVDGVTATGGKAVHEVAQGELNKETADDLRAAMNGLDDALAFYDEATRPEAEAYRE
jgi:hypothetical protein